MASYQIDFRNGENMDGAATYGLIMRYTGTSVYSQAQIGWDYYMGDNTSIKEVRRMYWKDRRDDDTGKVIGGQFVENPYVSNNKIGYGFFTDMVTQKVDTLFKETPTVNGIELTPKFLKRFGYVLRNGAERASAQGISYIYVDGSDNLNVFTADRAIPFYDDETGVLKAFIRWWTIQGMMLNDVPCMFWEVYTEDGVRTYSNRPSVREVKPLTAYKFKVKQSAFSQEIENEKSKIPIVEFWNNEYRISDLTPNIRAKIDIIDLVQSGFANNIQDFSDAYWVIKDTTGLGETYYQDFLANINRTKKIIGEGAEMKQFQIPTEARSKFVEIIKDDLIRDGGVVDTKALTNGNLTATAIKAARANLETRVSKFEWQAYKTASEVIDLYLAKNGISADFDITFNTYKIDNITETVQNALSLRGTISEESYLKMLQGVGIIDNVDDEILKMQEENDTKYGVGNKGIVDDDGEAGAQQE